MSRSVIPGFRLALGCTLAYLGVIVLLPLAALVWQAAGLGWERYVAVVTGPRALASFQITVLAAFGATAFNAVFGLGLAWVLVRYEFPGKRLLDALVDVPFALPTAVAGVALTALFAANGWYGSAFAEGSLFASVFGALPIAYAPLGIMVAMAFTSIPFVVRSVQPVLEDMSTETEEAAETLGAGPFKIFRSVVFPAIFPAFLAGCSLAFARSLGEFGAVIFIAGNQPFKTEIAALLVFIRLEEYDYQAAAAIASVMLAAAFVMLLVTNAIQLWHLRYARGDR